MAFMRPRAEFFSESAVIAVSTDFGFRCNEFYEDKPEGSEYNVPLSGQDHWYCAECKPASEYAGWYGQLSAPGYLDQTDYTGPFPTEAEALQAVMDEHDVDEDGNDPEEAAEIQAEIEAQPSRKDKHGELFDKPGMLFEGLEVVLFPNSRNEIWIGTPDGKVGVAITASMGPAGMGVTMRRFEHTRDMTVRSYNAKYEPAHDTAEGVREVATTIYNSDERSLAFARWYDGRATEADIQLLGPEYRRKEPRS